MNKLLSVIVPVYNVENTLDRCIKSISTQTYRNMEIILVDDGSTDRSREICEKWARSDKRIRITAPKINEGLAEARNLGIRYSNGEYLAFVDSDDFLELDAYEVMINIMERDNCDIVICNFWNYREIDKKRKKAYRMFDCCTSDVLIKALMEQLPTTAWCKILKRRIMQPEIGEAILFPKGRRYEDTVVSFKQIIAANKISFVSKPLYYYVQSNNTITAKPKKSDYSDIIKNSNELQSLLQQKVTDNLLACYICSSMVYALQLCYRVGNNPIVEKQKICKQIRDLSERFTFSDAMKSNKGLKLILCKLGIIDKVVKIIEENRR